MGNIDWRFTKVIRIYLTIWIILVKVSDGYKLCYSCNRIPYPRDCNHVTKCLETESCVTKEYVSDSGHVLYDSGCISKQRCASGKRSVRFSGDITVCQQCCEGELCNSHGCNSAELPDRQSRGPVCFSCNQQKYTDSCDIVSICQPSEICYLKFRLANVTRDPIYSTGCIAKSQCSSKKRFLLTTGLHGTADTSGPCTGCCDNDYCNRNCSAIGSVMFPTGKVPSSLAPSTTTTVGPQSNVTFEQKFCESAQYTFNAALGICYKLYTNITLPWQQARDQCRRDRGDLIIFHSVAEELFFEVKVKEIHKSRFWVGATDVLTEMNFQWLDGKTVDHAYFHANEPDNAYDGEDCLAITLFDNQAKRVLLNDDNCDLPSNFMCELKLNSLQNAHSAQESQQGHCSARDFTYAPDINTCYRVFTDHMTMTNARARCQRDVADLIILRNVNEEIYFQNLGFHDRNNDHRYWIGGTRTPEDKFEWLDGSPLSTTLKWFAGEPNNYEKNESCLSMTWFDGNRENFFLNDDNCAKQLYFICEEKCPDTTYRFISSLDLCFKIYNETVTWSEARDRCKHDRATLAEIDTRGKLAYFQVLLGEEARKSGHKYWIGANQSTNGDFHWLTTNHVVDKELWHSGEPTGTGEDCVALHWYPKPYDNNLKLNNRPCSTQDRYICQYIRGTKL